RDKRRALRHDLAAQTLLHRCFSLSKLGAGVHAENLICAAAQHMRVESIGFGERYCIGEIELAFGVGVADTRQKVRQGLAAAEAHDAGVAELYRALLFARVLLLADGDGPPALREKQAGGAPRGGWLRSDA